MFSPPNPPPAVLLALSLCNTSLDASFDTCLSHTETRSLAAILTSEIKPSVQVATIPELSRILYMLCIHLSCFVLIRTCSYCLKVICARVTRGPCNSLISSAPIQLTFLWAWYRPGLATRLPYLLTTRASFSADNSGWLRLGTLTVSCFLRCSVLLSLDPAGFP